MTTVKCARCPLSARPGREECQQCADKRAAYWQQRKSRLRPATTMARGDTAAHRSQTAREDEKALQWLRERGHRA